jgi:hypothetical protein
MFRELRRLVAAAAVTCTLAVSVGTAQAQIVGYFTDGNPGTTGPAAAITAAGFTPSYIADISVATFGGLDILMVNNSENSGYSPDLLSRAADIAAYVSSGGSFILHDRFVTDGLPMAGNPLLPGSGGITFLRDFTDDRDIDIVTPGTVDVGPGGLLNNSSLDGGTSSSHGWADASTLPVGAINILSNSDPNKSVAFAYQFGLGWVYYSTIPLDYYMDGNGPSGVIANMVNIYAPNMLAYEHSLQGGRPPVVPEPGTVAMLVGFGAASFAALRRARRS